MFPPHAAIPPDLYRIDTPNHPQAVVSSHLGSLLEERPENDAWREESMAIVDGGEGTGTVYPADLLEAIGAEAWHSAGHLGDGVRIAVFDVEWFGMDLAASELGQVETHDCFLHRSCLLPIDSYAPRYSFEQGRHGVACAEVIRDIAPQAELHLVRVNGLTTLENAVQWAIREEVDIVSMSLSFFNESFYDGTGPISEAAGELSDAGILLVTSAGNYAQQHFRDGFRDADRDGIHEFPDGNEWLAIQLSEGRHRLNLIWDEFGLCGKSDFDAYVWSPAGLLVGRGNKRQRADSNSCHPSERVQINSEESGWHYLQIHRHRGSSETRMDIMARGGSVYRAMAEGSIVDPGSYPGAFTVGAVRVGSYATDGEESFSSQGPTSSGWRKPEITGPNGIDTFSYGPQSFFGTSAATPAVAGAVALVLGADPALSPREAARFLEENALPGYGSGEAEKATGRARLPVPKGGPGSCRGGNSLAAAFWIGAVWRRRRRG
jgi:hypothetical protein